MQADTHGNHNSLNRSIEGFKNPGDQSLSQKKEIELEIDLMRKDIQRMESENNRILWEIERAVIFDR
jgi:hypothetical protein